MNLSQLKKALELLKNGFKPHPNELERDGIIQRFEFLLSFAGNHLKKY